MININNIDWINKGVKEIPFVKFTDIQKKTIPSLLRNENVVGVSETGTGKTYCFLLPMLNKVDFNNEEIQGVVIAPTRELARQIFSKFNYFKKFNNELKVQLVIGGEEIEKIKEKISKSKPQIIIATPQRFLELSKSKIKFNNINTIVFDEADMLIDLGFISIFKNIFDLLGQNKNLQKIAFSATLHEMLSNQLSTYFKNSKIIDVSKNIWTNDRINHTLIHTQINSDLKESLNVLLENINPYFCIIFCNTIKESEIIYKFLLEKNKNVVLLHGKLESRKRKNTYKAIQSFKYQYLVATDLASRGLDIDGASHIISLDLPKEDLWYIHRSGRSGRSKYYGESYVFFDNKYLANISRLKNKGINWKNVKINNNKLVNFDYVIKEKPKRKLTEVDIKIQHVINTSSKKVKPGYKKKIKEDIKKIKQRAKRKKIDESVKKILVIKYKKENAEKTRIKEHEALKRTQSEKRKNYKKK